MSAITRTAEALGRFSSRWVPSAFAIAVLLTTATFALAVTWGGASLGTALNGWGQGFWELLTLSMQMALVMFSGYVLALTTPVRKTLTALASLATTPRSAVVLVAVTSMALAALNWGLSIVASAMLVRFVVRRQPKVDYRLLVACAYFGLGATWHAGLSASAPLTVATPGHFLEAQLGVLSLDRTIFSTFNLVLLALTMTLLAVLAYLMHPPAGRAVTVEPSVLEEPTTIFLPKAQGTFASRLDNAWALNALFGFAGLAYWVSSLSQTGWRGLGLNSVNFLFLSCAVLFHRSPAALLKASDEAAGSLSGIVLQFPLYAGIYGLLKSTALTEKLGELFVSISTQKTFPALVYLYSGIVNYFVPSGGAKWAIEGPYLLKAAAGLGVAPEKVVLAYAWGDMATDLIQPFWALPLLGIAKLEFKDVLGFLLLAFFVYVPVVTVAFLLAG